MSRRKARELAIQILYQVDMTASSDIDHTLQSYFDNYPCKEENVKTFAESVVRGAHQNGARIDEAIANTAKNWSFSRITPVDRSILRAAVYEMLYCPDIPYKVTVNEAIELGKKFGSDKSGAFINGVLDNVLAQNPDIKDVS